MDAMKKIYGTDGVVLSGWRVSAAMVISFEEVEGTYRHKIIYRILTSSRDQVMTRAEITKPIYEAERGRYHQAEKHIRFTELRKHRNFINRNWKMLLKGRHTPDKKISLIRDRLETLWRDY